MISPAWRLAALTLALGLAAPAWAQVSCAAVAADSIIDSDGDGFTDAQECAGISLDLGTAAAVSVVGDPNIKDAFVIFAPASASLLPSGYNPFATQTHYGVEFSGAQSLGLRVHVLSPAQAAADRRVTAASAQKAVKVAESLDTSGTILGNCQWGTPLGLDGCVVYTKRAQDFIASTCGSAAVRTPGGVSSTAADVLLAYSTYLILHETGHSLGGLAAEYNSRFGGYHYKPGAGFVMEQAVTYSVKGGICTFYISPNWNQTLDAPAVKLK